MYPAIVVSLVVLFGVGLSSYRWHEHRKQQAYESVLVHGYSCHGYGVLGLYECHPTQHWSVPPDEAHRKGGE